MRGQGQALRGGRGARAKGGGERRGAVGKGREGKDHRRVGPSGGSSDEMREEKEGK